MHILEDGWMMDGWVSQMWIHSKVVDRSLLLNQLNVIIYIKERSHKLLAAFVRANRKPSFLCGGTKIRRRNGGWDRRWT